MHLHYVSDPHSQRLDDKKLLNQRMLFLWIENNKFRVGKMTSPKKIISCDFQEYKLPLMDSLIIKHLETDFCQLIFSTNKCHKLFTFAETEFPKSIFQQEFFNEINTFQFNTLT